VGRRALRIALTVLGVGLALEGAVALYAFLTPGADAPGLGLAFALPAVIAVLGFALTWAGRDEWDAVHRGQARTAGRTLGASFAGGIVAVLVIGLLVAMPGLGIPPWAPVAVALGVAGFVLGTFVTYAYLLYGLASAPARGAIALALGWAFGVSVAVGVIVAQNLPTMLNLAAQQAVVVPSFVPTVEATLAWLFVPFFLLAAAAVDGFVAVRRGRAGPVPGTSAAKAPPGARGPTASRP
jgi:hypothetical protein